MKAKDMALIALFAALIVICSWISIPATVPFTMQTFAVFLALGLLGGKRGTIAVLVYVMLGVIGLPVFSGFKSGVGVLLGSTGGYILGFILSGLIVWLCDRLLPRRSYILAVGMVLGLLVCYLFGTLWFMTVYVRTTGPVALGTVLSWCVIPFIIPDVIKLSLAFVLASQLRRFLPESGKSRA